MKRPPLRIRFARWRYLVQIGMWRGECAIEYADQDGIVCLASGTLQQFVHQTFRIWWQRDPNWTPSPNTP